MAKREIAKIDEAGELLEKCEQAEKARRVAWQEMERCREAFKSAKATHEAAAAEVFAASGARLERFPLLDENEDEELA